MKLLFDFLDHSGSSGPSLRVETGHDLLSENFEERLGLCLVSFIKWFGMRQDDSRDLITSSCWSKAG